MLVLNLADEKRSHIMYEISHFPDGQQQVKVLNIRRKSAIIKSRLNSFLDLELIACATASLRASGVKKIHLHVPYFLGARSDRKFEEGSNNYLKDIICPIINSLKFESIIVIDPHSDVLEACLNNFNRLENRELIDFAMNDLSAVFKDFRSFLSSIILVSPDAGAIKKISKVSDQLGYIGDIITCSKNRNTSGELSKTTVPLRERHRGKSFVIVDDICDGGATFLNIAKTIRLDKSFDDSKIYLIVTHGIFSKGFKELNKYFDGIYCTNSFSDLESPEMSLKYDDELHKVKQLNIF